MIHILQTCGLLLCNATLPYRGVSGVLITMTMIIIEKLITKERGKQLISGLFTTHHR